ncbi:MAG: hypothetical protein HYZ72_08830 [Deltaproteobacteria bacterium]|nr:hypothetical protein [Deltaproteobacteria bacterium]
MLPKTTRTSYEGVIDADGHINEPPDLWDNYLDPQYRDRAIRIRPGLDGLDHLELDGHRSRFFDAEILSRGRSMGLNFEERNNELSETARRNLLGDSAARVYGLN